MKPATLESRMLEAANIRAFEAWMVSIAREAKVPCRWAIDAHVAVSDPGLEPVVMVVVKLRARAWFALGLLHFLAWWRVRDKVGEKRSGYRVVVWAM